MIAMRLPSLSKFGHPPPGVPKVGKEKGGDLSSGGHGAEFRHELPCEVEKEKKKVKCVMWKVMATLIDTTYLKLEIVFINKKILITNSHRQEPLLLQGPMQNWTSLQDQLCQEQLLFQVVSLGNSQCGTYNIPFTEFKIVRNA